jgi:hypothetical protein
MPNIRKRGHTPEVQAVSSKECEALNSFNISGENAVDTNCTRMGLWHGKLLLRVGIYEKNCFLSVASVTRVDDNVLCLRRVAVTTELRWLLRKLQLDLGDQY